jgi:hypothetical protein
MSSSCSNFKKYLILYFNKYNFIVCNLDYPSQVIPTKDSTLLQLLYDDTEFDKQSTIVLSHKDIDGMFI